MAYASSIDELYARLDRNERVFKGAAIYPLKELLSPETMDYHDTLVSDESCRIALSLIARNFGQKNPSYPNPADSGKAYVSWIVTIAPRHYASTFFCYANSGFQQTYKSLMTAKKKPWQLYQKQRPAKPSRRLRGVRDRLFNWTKDLIISAIYDHAPALLKLAQLSEKAEVIRLTPAYNYYALARAKHKGLDYPDLNRLLAKAEKDISPEEKKRLAPRIAAGGWPREEAIVID